MSPNSSAAFCLKLEKTLPDFPAQVDAEKRADPADRYGCHETAELSARIPTAITERHHRTVNAELLHAFSIGPFPGLSSLAKRSR